MYNPLKYTLFKVKNINLCSDYVVICILSNQLVVFMQNLLFWGNPGLHANHIRVIGSNALFGYTSLPGAGCRGVYDPPRAPLLIRYAKLCEVTGVSDTLWLLYHGNIFTHCLYIQIHFSL